MLFAQRHGVNRGDVKLAKQHHHVAANEGDVHVTRPRAVGIEGLIRSKFVPGDRTAAQDDFDARRRSVTQDLHELLVASLVAAEHEANYALANLPLTLRVPDVREKIGAGVRLVLFRIIVCFFRHAVGSTQKVCDWSAGSVTYPTRYLVRLARHLDHGPAKPCALE